MATINFLDEDLLLWDKFRNGDADAFAALISVHYQDLFNYGVRIARDEELVKDSIQDLLLLLWKNRTTINGTSFVKYYLLKSLRRRLIRAVGHKRHSASYSDTYFEGMVDQALFGQGAGAADDVIQELSQKIRTILQSIPVRQQEAIYLRYYLDADIDEIAEIMDLNRQSVYNLLHRALKKIRKSLSEYNLPFYRLSGLFFL